jgi:hypothetical protein
LLFFLAPVPFGSVFYLSYFLRLPFEDVWTALNDFFSLLATGLFRERSWLSGFMTDRAFDSLVSLVYLGSARSIFKLSFLTFLKFPETLSFLDRSYTC